MTGIPHLFGTSGIRGVFSAENVIDPVRHFISGNFLTPSLAYLLAKAIAQLVRKSDHPCPVEIWRDVRDSGDLLAGALFEGFHSEKVPVVFRGIAPTTLYAARSNHWVIVVTASHNPSIFNGLKVFREGRPLERHLELEVESFMADWSGRLSAAVMPSTLPLDPAVLDETRQIQIRHLLQESSFDDSITCSSDEQHFLPVDLAYGAAACPVDSSGRITSLSPQLTVLLSTGIPIVGYGCTQDPVRTNESIGAAYAYGETSVSPGDGELSAFSRGEYGYGAPAERIVFWPGEGMFPDRIVSELAPGRLPKDTYYKIHINELRFPLSVTVMHLDQPGVPESIQNAFHMEFVHRKPLPGFMVDCDADRILVTTPNLASMPVPYLTGDGMIRFFAETAAPDTWDEVAYTVESGLSVDIALERIVQCRTASGLKAFSIRKVTVGDRAIIDCFLDAGPGTRMGGEPSGHMIFHSREGDDHHLIDDPFITYLLMLRRLNDLETDLDTVMHRLFSNVPEVYCARKPDARCGTGLTPDEKSALELWERGHWGDLSRYASAFIPEYTRYFGDTAGDLLSWGKPSTVTMTDQWQQLIHGTLLIPDEGWQMPLASIGYTGNLSIQAFLYLDHRPWAGPEVIRIAFFSGSDDRCRRRIGEGVFRNSGTGPKNAGYHKFWIMHPISDEPLQHESIIRAMNALAIRRVAFTDRYIADVLRSR